jgi:hypothetical protein
LPTRKNPDSAVLPNQTDLDLFRMATAFDRRFANKAIIGTRWEGDTLLMVTDRPLTDDEKQLFVDRWNDVFTDGGLRFVTKDELAGAKITIVDSEAEL